MRRQSDEQPLRCLAGPPSRTPLTVAVMACLAGGSACGNGARDPSVYNPPVPVTLAWDQPDGLAEYYHVKTGALLLRADEPTIRLQLEAGAHRVEITSCNATGCSRPTAVMLDYREGRWVLTYLPPETSQSPNDASRDVVADGARRPRE
jgi:hypothetical protein